MNRINLYKKIIYARAKLKVEPKAIVNIELKKPTKILTTNEELINWFTFY